MFWMCNRFTCTHLTLDSIKFKEKTNNGLLHILQIKYDILKKQSDNLYFAFRFYS